MIATTPKPITQIRAATWAEYLELRDDPNSDWQRISYDYGWLRIEMGKEGPGHASISDLLHRYFLYLGATLP